MDKYDRQTRSRIMSAIKSKNTIPEVTLRRALWKKGLRYSIHYGTEKIDVAFPKKRVAIFIDGCFWHQCPLHSNMPSSRKEYWIPKLEKNVERDKAKDKRLIGAGWKVIHVWEHDLKDDDRILFNVDVIIKILKEREV